MKSIRKLLTIAAACLITLSCSKTSSTCTDCKIDSNYQDHTISVLGQELNARTWSYPNYDFSTVTEEHTHEIIESFVSSKLDYNPEKSIALAILYKNRVSESYEHSDISAVFLYFIDANQDMYVSVYEPNKNTYTSIENLYTTVGAINSSDIVHFANVNNLKQYSITYIFSNENKIPRVKNKTLDELYKAIERSKSTDAYKTNEPEANDNNCKAPCTPNNEESRCIAQESQIRGEQWNCYATACSAEDVNVDYPVEDYHIGYVNTDFIDDLYEIRDSIIRSGSPCLQNMEDEYYHISTYLHGNWTPSAMISTVDLFLNTVKPCATNLIDPSYGDNQIILSTNDKINLFNYLDLNVLDRFCMQIVCK